MREDYEGMREDYEDMLATEHVLRLEFDASRLRFKTGEPVHDKAPDLPENDR